MANRTVKDAVSIKGTNPQYLIEKIIRTRIYDARFWKEDCFALTAELLVDKAMELKSVGGIYGGNVKPTPFLCLILKMLQIQPEKDIIIEFIRNEDFKYVRALGAFYMRLTASSADVYKYLEPLYIDYRKMKRMNKQAKYELLHMDEFIDELLHGDRVCDISLPRLQKRNVLEELNEIEPRISALDVNLDDAETSSESEDEEDDESSSQSDSQSSSSSNSRSTSRDRHKKRSSHHHDHHRRRHSRDKRDSRRRNSSDRQQQRSRKYVDYDNPKEEDEMPMYKRPSEARKRSSRSRSRSKDRRRSRSSPQSSSKRRSRSRDRRDASSAEKKSKHKSSHKSSRRDD